MPMRMRKKLFMAYKPTEDEVKLRNVQKELKDLKALVKSMQETQAVASSKKKVK